MTFVLPSASSLPRAQVCIDSEFILPRINHAPTIWSEIGNFTDRFIQRVQTGASKEEALEDIPEDSPARQSCADMDMSLIPSGGHFQIALAWDYRTGKGRVLGYDIGRNYEAAGADRSIEFVGSLDFAGVRADGVGIYVDFKAGWKTRKAKDSWQLKFGAVAIADTFDLDHVIVAHQHVRPGEDPFWDICEMDSMALAAVRKGLRDLAARLATGKRSGALVEGPECVYCPVYKSCEAKTSHMRAIAGIATGLAPDLSGLPAIIEKPTEELLTQAARAVRMLELYDEASKHAWAELEAFAATTPIDLGDGRVMKLAPGQAKDEIKSAPVILESLARFCDAEAVQVAQRTNKGALTEAVASWARRTGQPIGKSQEAFLKVARANGEIEKVTGEVKVRLVKEKK